MDKTQYVIKNSNKEYLQEMATTNEPIFTIKYDTAKKMSYREAQCIISKIINKN